MARRISENAILVVGLGRFGSAIASTLERRGYEVLAVDANMDLVQEWSGTLTHVVQADATNESAMRQIGAADFKVGVVAIGSDIEASVLSTSILADIGVEDIWTKAITKAHGKILKRIGADHVVHPEHDAGLRVAHLITEKAADFMEFADGFAIVEVHPPADLVDTTISHASLSEAYGVTIVGIKRPHHVFEYAQGEISVSEQDMLIVAGPTDQISRFSSLR